jgi:hypothetical protein
MSSHWEWAQQVAARHDATCPYAPENGQQLRFKIGDSVIFTNRAGIEFHVIIAGYYERPQEPCGLYAQGARYLLSWESPWFPVAERTLRHDQPGL